jgi:hypothetical protein
VPMGYQLLWGSADDSAAAESYGCGSTVNRCQRFSSGSESGSRWVSKPSQLSRLSRAEVVRGTSTVGLRLAGKSSSCPLDRKAAEH